LMQKYKIARSLPIIGLEVNGTAKATIGARGHWQSV
jgi:hypothetical protein